MSNYLSMMNSAINKLHRCFFVINIIISVYTVKSCYRVHALKLKNSSISACVSSNLIGSKTKKYWKIRVIVHAELRKVLRYVINKL